MNLYKKFIKVLKLNLFYKLNELRGLVTIVKKQDLFSSKETLFSTRNFS